MNLRHGVEEKETTTTCLAGAGTLVLEFGVLARLSGYNVFNVRLRTRCSATLCLFLRHAQEVVTRTTNTLIEKRSRKNMVPGMIDVNTGRWCVSV